MLHLDKSRSTPKLGGVVVNLGDLDIVPVLKLKLEASETMRMRQTRRLEYHVAITEAAQSLLRQEPGALERLNLAVKAWEDREEL